MNNLSMEEMVDILGLAKQKILEQQVEMDQFMATPGQLGTIVELRPRTEKTPNLAVGDHVRIVESDTGYEGMLAQVVRVHARDKAIVVQYTRGATQVLRYREDEDDWVESTRHPEYSRAVPFGLSFGTAVVSSDGRLAVVELPDPEKFALAVGDTVRVIQGAIVAKEETSLAASGDVVKVVSVLSDTIVEVEAGNGTRAVLAGCFAGQLEDGDRVVLDSGSCMVVSNLGHEESNYAFEGSTGVTWDDIGGLEEAKQEMVEAIEYPVIHAELYRFYGKSQPKGILLYGPPGCGKTMLGKAAATRVRELYGGQGAHSAYIYVKGPEVLDKWVGSAEARIRSLFDLARRHKAEHGYPAILFIDEADAILGKRGGGISSDIRDTTVPMFLAEMDGLEDSAAILLLATNRPDALDPAVVRDGRVDRKVRVGRPDAAASEKIFGIYLNRVPLAKDLTAEEVGQHATAMLFGNSYPLYKIALKANGSGEKPVVSFNLSHLVNGAMIAGIVDQATSLAMRRDMQSKGKPKGVVCDDLSAAIGVVYRQNRDLNHNDEVTDFVQAFRNEVAEVRRVLA